MKRWSFARFAEIRSQSSPLGASPLSLSPYFISISDFYRSYARSRYQILDSKEAAESEEMESSRARSSGPLVQMNGYGFHRSVSPNGRLGSTYSHPSSPSSFCSTSAAFYSPSSGFFTRSLSPTRVNIYGLAPAGRSVKFSFDGTRSPSRSLAGMPMSSHRDTAVKKQNQMPSPPPRRTCMCSPTTHPGSFRCSLHKNTGSPSNRLDARRSSMTNSLVRIGTVEGEWVRRALAALIRPSSHQQRRRATFQRRPSRLSVMSKAEELS